MLEYIYFVKCPGCEDEHFSFFDKAKDFAMSCLSQKPIITQVEVDRNDFGECVDSTDLGTVWSWEEMMKAADEPAKCIFTQGDFDRYNPDNDSEFNALDNSLDSVPDNFRKPVPADMTVDAIVEEMEENEDTVECKWCEELFDKSECRYEVDMGWLCDRCQQAIQSRGEPLTFREGPLEETFNKNETVGFNYDNLTITVFGNKRDADDWDEWDHSGPYTYYVPKDTVATDIWENFITEEDVVDAPGGLESLEDDTARENFLEMHFDALFDKYQKQLLDYYEEAAANEFQDKFNSGEYDYDGYDEDAAYEERRYNQMQVEDINKVSVNTGTTGMLEELEEPGEYRKRLTSCPECGAEQSFDHETGFCIDCGFNI